MDESWESIFSSSQPYQAEILKDLLLGEDIPAVVINKQDSSYLAFGEIEVFVHREDILKAKLILSKFLANE
jgi:hypothetical protein